MRGNSTARGDEGKGRETGEGTSGVRGSVRGPSVCIEGWGRRPAVANGFVRWKGQKGRGGGGGWGDYDANYSVRQCGPAIYYNINAEAKLQIGG